MLIVGCFTPFFSLVKSVRLVYLPNLYPDRYKTASVVKKNSGQDNYLKFASIIPAGILKCSCLFENLFDARI